MEKGKKTILIIGAGVLQIPVIRSALNRGLYTLVLDGNPSASGVRLADGFIHASTLDPEDSLHKVRDFLSSGVCLDGVLTVGTDASVTVATVAQAYGLPGISVETAMRATNKFEMRRALKDAGVAVPRFFEVERYHDAIEIFEKLDSDCVIKPLRNMGARGIRRVNHPDELKEAFELALSFSRDGRVIMESYIQGPELSIDALIDNGRIFITGVADRIIEYDPYFVETGHVMPSSLPQTWIERAIATFKEGIYALGITHGAAKGDIKINETTCLIGEIAARLSGGFMSTLTYPLSSGVDLMDNMIRLALGEPIGNLNPICDYVAVERAIIAPPGIIQSVDGLEEVRSMKGVAEVFFRSKPGDKIKSPRNNLDKCGNVIVSAPTREEAIKLSHEAVKHIRVKTIEDDDQILSKHETEERARLRFGDVCAVCKVCDGMVCRGKVPGIGGIGNGEAFIRSVKAFQRYRLIPRYLHSVKVASTHIEFLGEKLDLPFIPAPITGSVTNLNGAIGELALARAMVKGANHAGTIGTVGDGATPSKYRIGLKAVFENFGQAIPFFKPRGVELILERIKAAESVGAIAFGIDVDSVKFITMKNRKQETYPKSRADLEYLASQTKLPMIIKGILSVRDAEVAIEAGASALVVSNHGGRVNDALVSPIEVLSSIAAVSNIPVILDGGVRSANDVVRAMLLGADLVMAGRPVLIQAVGGGVQGVRQWIQNLRSELEQLMILLGVSSIEELKDSRDRLLLK